MKRSLVAPVALAFVAALALLAWRWLAPAPARLPAPPPREAKAETPAPPAPPPVVRAERDEEAPARPIGRDAAIAALSGRTKEIVRLPVELSVVDRATRAPLSGVVVCSIPFQTIGMSGALDDAPELPALFQGDSPLAIPAAQSETALMSFLVRAPGHASAAVSLDFRSGGQREVALEAACELDLMIEAPPGDEKYRYELRRLDDAARWLSHRAAVGESYASGLGRMSSSTTRAQRAAVEGIRLLRSDLAKNGEALGRFATLARATWSRAAKREEWSRFDRLAPGDWVASVVEEKRRDAPLATVVLRLDAGAVERRTLVPKERAAVPTVAVHGTVVLDPGWGRDEATHQPTRLLLDRAVRLVGLPAEASHRVVEKFEPAGSSRYAWSAGKLANGLWIARLPQFGVVQEFEFDVREPIDENQQVNVELEVGPPCDVDLALVDARTKKGQSFSQITVWSGSGDAGDTGGESRRVECDESDLHFRFRAPLGRLHVRVDLFDASFFVAERAFDLAPGHNDLLFALEPIGRVRLGLTDGVAGVPWSDDYHVEARPANGSGGLVGFMFDGTGVELIVAPAGRYSISVDGLPGFEPAGPFDVEVPAGGRVELPIPLQRVK